MAQRTRLTEHVFFSTHRRTKGGPVARTHLGRSPGLQPWPAALARRPP